MERMRGRSHLRLIDGTEVPPEVKTPPARENACNHVKRGMLHLGGLTPRSRAAVDPGPNTNEGFVLNARRALRDLPNGLLGHVDAQGDLPNGDAAGPDSVGYQSRSDVMLHAPRIPQIFWVRNGADIYEVSRAGTDTHRAPMTGDALRKRLQQIMDEKGIKGPYQWANMAGDPKRGNTLAAFMKEKKTRSLNAKTLEWMARAVGMTVGEMIEPDQRETSEPASDLSTIKAELLELQRQQTKLLERIVDALDRIEGAPRDRKAG